MYSFLSRMSAAGIVGENGGILPPNQAVQYVSRRRHPWGIVPPVQGYRRHLDSVPYESSRQFNLLLLLSNTVRYSTILAVSMRIVQLTYELTPGAAGVDIRWFYLISNAHT